MPDAFQQWYAAQSKRYGLSPNPDSPEQLYDYRAAFKANATPDASGHWPSQFKKPGHPNEIVGGFNTRTGERAPGTPRAKSAEELVGLGWEPATAAKLMTMPEPNSTDDRRTLLVSRMVAEGTSDDDIRATLKAFDAQAQPAAPAAPARTWGDTARDVAVGFGKGAAASVANLGELAANAGMLPGVQPSLMNPAMRPPAFTRAEEATTATNTPQMIGKGLETVAEMAIPVLKGGQAAVQAFPTTAKAGAKFQDVMGAARHVPINIDGPGAVALRIQELADRGGSMPMAVRKFLLRVTDPEKGAMNYEEARDFASNISRLSANEFGRLTPAVAREVAEMRVALNKSVAEAAGKAGKGAEYAKAMTEYARAMRLKNAVNEFVTGAKRVAPYATAVGAGTWLTAKIQKALGGD